MNRDRDKRIKEKSPIELFTYLSLYFKKEIKMVTEILEKLEGFATEHPYVCIVTGATLFTTSQFMYYRMLNNSIRDAVKTVAKMEKKKSKKNKKETED